MPAAPPTAHVVLDVLPVHPHDAFSRVLLAARAAGLVGAMVDHPDARASESALVALACDERHRPYRVIDGSLTAIEPDEIVREMRRRTAGAVRLSRSDGGLLAESVLPAAAERWRPPAPRRWAWSVAPLHDGGSEIRGLADGLGARLVELELDGRRLVVGSTDAQVAWSRTERPVIGLSVDAASAMLTIHAEARRMGRRRPRGLAATAVPDVSLGWGPPPTPLVLEPEPVVAAAQDAVMRMLAPSIDAEAEAQIRHAMAAIDRAAHADELLSLSLEDLESDTVARVLHAVGAPEALSLLASGEVEPERLHGAIVHEPSRARTWAALAAVAGWYLVLAGAGGWIGATIAQVLAAPWPIGAVVGGALAVVSGWTWGRRLQRG